MSKRRKDTDKSNIVKRDEEIKTVRKIVAIIIFILLIVIAIGSYVVYNYIKTALDPVDPSSDEEITVEIPLGSTTATISEILEDNGIIKNATIFRVYLKLKNHSDFQAGEYTFSPASSVDEIVETLKSGEIVQDAIYTVTIPEGKTIEEIADIYAKSLPFEKEEFIDKVNDPDYIEELIDKFPLILSEDVLDPEIQTPLEGYLFGATYEFYEENPSIEQIVETMLNKTVEVVTNYYDEIEKMNYSIHEVITFASLLENEARNNEERQLISGIFYNRLREDMPLQTDPTVLYALGEHKDRVLYEDLEIDSPYNTYQITSLPIGPISNFSESSLKATIEPEDTDYMYFLHDEEGNIHYAETHEEHEELKEKYRP